MGFEIEIKAHVKDYEIQKVMECVRKIPGCIDLGKTDKKDIYWALDPDDNPLFRTRYEIKDDGEHILFTSKPLKQKTNGTECNVEN